MITKTDRAIIASYFEDSSYIKDGHADAVLIPETTGELAAVVKDAHERRTPVTISGGGTTTTGSRVPYGGIVVSLERLDAVETITPGTAHIRVEAGASVDAVKLAAERAGLFYTSHPTERAATIGGTVATNASGSRSFRYGPTRACVRMLSMILATGERWTLRRGEHSFGTHHPTINLPGGRTLTIPLPHYTMPETKNSAGYYWKDGMDLIDLFIGQEGTLSVITEVELALAKRPSEILSVFAFFKREDDAWDFAQAVRALPRTLIPDTASRLEPLSVEYFGPTALEFLRAKNPHVPEAGAAIFFEEERRTITPADHAETWLQLIEKHGGTAEDTWVAMTEKDARRFTEMRYAIPESINELVARSGFPKVSTDIAVPENGFRALLTLYRDTLRSVPMRSFMFGHIGECHLHVNILPTSAAEYTRAREVALRFITKGVALGGTVSAEHGIGKTKRPYLEIMYGSEGVRDMARIKKTFDPNCILGLDNIFPRELLIGM